MSRLARDGAGARPIAVTIAGWALVADAVVSLVVITVNTVSADLDAVGRAIGFGLLVAVAVLEIWIGRGLLQRRRWLLGVLFPAFFLVAFAVLPPLPAEPLQPLYSVIYSWIAAGLWAFVIVALIWHRPWFTASDEGIAARLRRSPGA